MADKKTKVRIGHASFWYVDEEGRHRVALHGDEIEVGSDDYDRGVRFEAFATDPDADGGDDVPTDFDGPPAERAKATVWEAYARSRGFTDEELKGLKKPQLVELATNGTPASASNPTGDDEDSDEEQSDDSGSDSNEDQDDASDGDDA